MILSMPASTSSLGVLEGHPPTTAVRRPPSEPAVEAALDPAASKAASLFSRIC